MIVNSAAPPFDNAKVRRAMALALDRGAFNTILAEGKSSIGAVMLPGPEGVWSMPPEELAKLPGYSPDRAKDLAEARKVMEELGYSAASRSRSKSPRNIPSTAPSVIFIDR